MTSEAKHTLEPWHASNKVGYIFGPDRDNGYVNICIVGGFISDPDCAETSGERWQADTDRIVACVNACTGIPTEQLEAECVKGLIDALKYARRFMNAEDHDVEFADSALAPFQKESV